MPNNPERIEVLAGIQRRRLSPRFEASRSTLGRCTIIIESSRLDDRFALLHSEASH